MLSSEETQKNNIILDLNVRSEGTKTQPWPRSLAQTWTIMLLLVTCLLYCARMAMPVCAVAMATEFGWSKTEIGVVMSGFFWGYCFTQIVGGHVSDRIGGERVLLMSTIAWASIATLTPVLTHLNVSPLITMTTARFLMGLFQGVHYPCLTSVCAQRVEDGERGFVMSIIGCGCHLGVLSVGGVGSVILEWYSWEPVFTIVGFLSAMWAFSVWKYLLKAPARMPEVPEMSSNHGHQLSPQESASFWLKLCMEPAVLSMVFAHLCFSSSYYTLISWLPTFFKETYPHAKGCVFNVVPWFVAMVSSLIGGSLSSYLIKMGYKTVNVRKMMQFCSMGLSGMFLLMLCRNPSFTLAVALVSAAVGLGTFNSSGVTVNVHDLAPSCAGALFGIMNTCGAFSGLLLVYFSGYLIELTQSWASVFFLLTLVNAMGLIMFLLLGEARRLDL
ncbi:solute carrier family 17 member 9 [Alosa sapidissima]|uniref:solute carrier family 17 member 9 n=1 Tax=Alosa sapidissima TaxID=34773 RepID=UPI001C082290|nr:solute carrier family 17 member 9 [Alosa sapidissima]